MAERDPLPEADCLEGAPHPRHAAQVFGHGAAEDAFLRAHASGRLHHAWMITGPKGVGKASLAWRMARFLLATPEDGDSLFAPPPPDTLDIAADHPVSRRIAALSEPRLFLLRRTWDEKAGRLRAQIAVDDARAMKNFFNLSAADGGARVAMIDAADDMNPSTANAVLKLLEEPPPRVTFFLITHQPHRLLPTIRSRCRELRLSALAPDALAQALAQAGAEVPEGAQQALAELAGGSVGEAFRLTELDGLNLYAGIVALLSGLPRLDRPRLLTLAEAGAARGAEQTFDLILTLIDLFLSRLARAAARRELPPEAAPGEAQAITRLADHPSAATLWAEAAQHLSIRARRGKAVNLDPAALLMDMIFQLEATAARIAQR